MYLPLVNDHQGRTRLYLASLDAYLEPILAGNGSESWVLANRELLKLLPREVYPLSLSAFASHVEPQPPLNSPDDLILGTRATVSSMFGYATDISNSFTPSVDEGRRSFLHSDHDHPPSSHWSRPRHSTFPNSGSTGPLGPQHGMDIEEAITKPDVAIGGGSTLLRKHGVSRSGMSPPLLTLDQPMIDEPSSPLMRVSIQASQAKRTKEVRFACVLWGQTFRKQHNLTIHRNLHLGLKGYFCEGCKKGVATHSLSAQHQRVCKCILNTVPV